MATTSTLETLVFGERRPDLQLLARGLIDSSWFADYETALDAELEASSGSTWARSLVQTSHWVSFYLPLRVRFASHTVGVTADVCNQVFNLHITIERKLLISLASSIDDNVVETLRSNLPLTSPEHEIIRLSLGSGNPTSAIYKSSCVGTWKDAFATNWKPVALDLQRISRWNKWLIMAARLGSFYWDLLFAQNITLQESVDCDIPTLQSVLPPSTLAIIHAILNPLDSEIDETGLPSVGSNTGFNKLSVRRLVEPIMMSRSDEIISSADLT